MSEQQQQQDIKAFLYAWLGKNKKSNPEYDVRPAGGKHRQRFLCNLAVPGYEYVACGNSTNKKDAQTNAARDFVQFLERRGDLQGNEVPQEIMAPPQQQQQEQQGFQHRPDLGLHQRQRMAPAALGEAYR